MYEFPNSGQLQSIGLTLADFHSLSHQQRQLINWIRQQKSCSLLEIAVHFCQDEETIFKVIVPLIKKGFLQQKHEPDGLYYRVLLAPKRGRKLPLKLKQALEKADEENEGNN